MRKTRNRAVKKGLAALYLSALTVALGLPFFISILAVFIAFVVVVNQTDAWINAGREYK